MKLRINSRDLGYTIDTYGMYTGDSTEEMEIDYISTEYQLTEEEWRQLEFNYNHPEIVKDLAGASINLLHNEFVEHGEGIIKSINLDTTQSPQFYNYTTDSYTAIWDVNIVKLRQALKGYEMELEKFLREEWSLAEPGTEDYNVALLDFYTRSIYAPEDYEMSMFELETEAYINNMELTDEAKATVEQAQKRLEIKNNQSEMEF